VITRAGVAADLFPELDPAEHAALRASAALLRDLADAVPLCALPFRAGLGHNPPRTIPGPSPCTTSA
jgi:hypothetical protein